MYQIIRTYTTTPEAVPEILRRTNNEFVPLVKNALGFQDYYFIDYGNGKFATVSLFENRADSQNFHNMAMDWLHTHFKGLLPKSPSVSAGEVRIHASASVFVSA